MSNELHQETEEELMERFDKEMRAALLEEANRLRKEKGYPLVTEEDVSDIDTLSRLKEYEKKTSKMNNAIGFPVALYIKDS